MRDGEGTMQFVFELYTLSFVQLHISLEMPVHPSLEILTIKAPREQGRLARLTEHYLPHSSAESSTASRVSAVMNAFVCSSPVLAAEIAEIVPF